MHPHLHFIIKFGKILVRYIAPNKMGMHMYKIYEKWDTKIISYFLYIHSKGTGGLLLLKISVRLMTSKTHRYKLPRHELQ